MFDESDDYLSAEIKSIIDHRYVAGILEFKLEYTNGDTSWHPLALVKYEDAHATANYFLSNDLGYISNGIHRRWARMFLRSLKRTLRRLRRTDFYSFESTTFDTNP